MNLIKHREFFNPDELKDQIHIIGCGAIGSTIAEQLARLGIKKLYLYDFDKVTEHNITNQMFLHRHIGMLKTQALSEILHEINPEITVVENTQGWTPDTVLNGYVILAVDNIDTRKNIVEDNIFNKNIKAMFDTRMRLTDAQHFAALWDPKGIAELLATMQFSQEEAESATPVSACGTSLSVTPTVRGICAIVVANIINTIQKKPITKLALIDPFNMTLDAFDENGFKE